MSKQSIRNTNYKNVSTVRIVVLTVAILIVWLMANIDTASNKIFGYQVNGDYGMPLINHIMTLSGITLLILFLKRSNLTWQYLKKLTMNMLAIFLFLFGWTLAAAEWGVGGLHNDGYSVTGAFLMFFSGLYFGYLFARNTLDGKK